MRFLPVFFFSLSQMRVHYFCCCPFVCFIRVFVVVVVVVFRLSILLQLLFTSMSDRIYSNAVDNSFRERNTNTSIISQSLTTAIRPTG